MNWAPAIGALWFLSLLSASAWADGAAVDEGCVGKDVGDACVNPQNNLAGTCVYGEGGFGTVRCATGGMGGAAGGTGTGGLAGSGGAVAAGARDAGEGSESDGCSTSFGRRRGGPELVGLALLIAGCVVVERKRRRRSPRRS